MSIYGHAFDLYFIENINRQLLDNSCNIEIVTEGLSISNIIDKFKEIIDKFLEWLKSLKEKFLDKLIYLYESHLISLRNKVVSKYTSKNEAVLLENEKEPKITVKELIISNVIDESKAGYYKKARLGASLKTKDNISHIDIDDNNYEIIDEYENSIIQKDLINILLEKGVSGVKEFLEEESKKSNSKYWKTITINVLDDSEDSKMIREHGYFESLRKTLRKCITSLDSSTKVFKAGIQALEDSSTKFNSTNNTKDEDIKRFKALIKIISVDKQIIEMCRDFVNKYYKDIEKAMRDLL